VLTGFFFCIIINELPKVTFRALAVSMYAGLQILIHQLNFCKMKKTTLAACTLAALIITCTSCDWFSKKSNNGTPSIVGKWKIDSLYPTGKDSSSLAYLLYAVAKTDKDSVTIQFNADSTFTELATTNATTKKYYQKDKEIYIQEDSTFKPYVLAFKNDSTVSFLAKDSMLLVLKRQ